MELIGEGNTAQIYDYGDGKILKVFRPGIDEYIIKQEYHNSSVVAEVLGDLVPKVYGRTEYEGLPGIVYERIEGQDVLKMMISSLSGTKRNSERVAQCHISIQKEITKDMLTVKDKLKAEIEAVEELTSEEKERILAHLKTLPEGHTLCHFDFHPGNIMIQNGKPVVLDWMTACVGDPFADVARTSIMLRYAIIPNVAAVVNLVFRIIKRRIYHYYIAEYQQATKAKMADIEQWYLPIMAGRLREWLPMKERKRLLIEIRKILKEGR